MRVRCRALLVGPEVLASHPCCFGCTSCRTDSHAKPITDEQQPNAVQNLLSSSLHAGFSNSCYSLSCHHVCATTAMPLPDKFRWEGLLRPANWIGRLLRWNWRCKLAYIYIFHQQKSDGQTLALQSLYIYYTFVHYSARLFHAFPVHCQCGTIGIWYTGLHCCRG